MSESARGECFISAAPGMDRGLAWVWLCTLLLNLARTAKLSADPHTAWNDGTWSTPVCQILATTTPQHCHMSTKGDKDSAVKCPVEETHGQRPKESLCQGVSSLPLRFISTDIFWS
ncbi:unnamed protein product [Pleuronectes platessa]|uniref:Uncharacterized protein n=1 Tax=Pleuronectes platessa TaxID=8262 RepID=A0A9N7YC34_PLEPL|nr:unnamed protein product [Pleuronectes platessa]